MLRGLSNLTQPCCPSAGHAPTRSKHGHQNGHKHQHKSNHQHKGNHHSGAAEASLEHEHKPGSHEYVGQHKEKPLMDSDRDAWGKQLHDDGVQRTKEGAIKLEP